MKRRAFFSITPLLASVTPALASTNEKPQAPPRPMTVDEMIVEQLRTHGPDRIVYGWSNRRHDAVQLGLADAFLYLHTAHNALQNLERAGFTPKQEFLDQIARAEQVREQGRPVTTTVPFFIPYQPVDRTYFLPKLKAVLASKVKEDSRWPGFFVVGADFEPVRDLELVRTADGYTFELPDGIEARIIWSWSHEPGLTISQTWQFERDAKIFQYGTGLRGPIFNVVNEV